MATLTALASSYTGSTFGGGVTGPANAYTDTSSTTYAQFATQTRTSGTSEVYLTGFDFSKIPSDARINGVTIKIKAMVSSTSYLNSATCQAYAGTTAKGTTTSYFATTASVYTLAVVDWTRSELDTMRIKFNTNRTNTRNNAAYVRIYGIEVIVDWSRAAGSTYLQIKQSGTWKDVDKVLKKVNGVWVEQTDLKDVFDENTEYVRWN